MSLDVYADKDRLAEAAARLFVERAQRSVDGTGRFAVALAGGSTPQRAYELLADAYRDDLDWGKVHVFFGDERGVPPDHGDSNYRMANEALLSRVPVGSVHRMRGELPPSEAAADYERELRGFFGGPPVYSTSRLGHSGMLDLHARNGMHPELREAFVRCFDAAVQAQLPADPELRRAMHDYMEWATREVMLYDAPDSVVPGGLPIPRWDWSGPMRASVAGS